MSGVQRCPLKLRGGLHIKLTRRSLLHHHQNQESERANASPASRLRSCGVWLRRFQVHANGPADSTAGLARGGD